MADITRTKARVKLTRAQDSETFEVVAGATIEPGQPCYVDSNGKAQLSDANGSGTDVVDGLALNDATSGVGVTLLKRGTVYGFTLSGAYRSKAYVSNTVGELSDSAGGTSLVVGHVMVIPEDGNPTKVLHVDIPYT